MRVIGIDPGTAVTGFGLVDGASGAFSHVAAGTIRAGNVAPGPRRLQSIYKRILELIDQYAPSEMSLERNFVALNAQSAFRLGEARAIAMLAAAERKLTVYEYAPTAVKLAVAAYGRADKGQVKYMVRRILSLDESAPLPDDAADALALALCHLGQSRSQLEATAAAARVARRRAQWGIR